jgi:outer membrane protein OmpA-like peptidoglycan-associated protein
MSVFNDPKIYLALCVAVIVFVGIVTLRWPGFRDSEARRGRGLVQFTAICLAVAFLFITISKDRNVAESTKSRQESYEAQAKLAEDSENEMASRVEKLDSENKDLETLLKQTSAQKKEAAEEAKRLRATLIDAAKTVGEVIPNPGNDSITLRINDAALFDFDKSSLSCDSREKLSRVIGFLTYQVRTPHTQIQVFGHTDITGSDAHDDVLSSDRANEVKRYFVGSGIPSEIIQAIAMGKRQPAGYTSPQSPEVIRRANVTDEQRRKNRRVEIIVSTSS